MSRGRPASERAVNGKIMGAQRAEISTPRAWSWQSQPPWLRYALSVGLVTLVTLLGVPIVSSIAPTNLVMIYLVAVVVAAIYLGRGPSILAAILGVLALDFFFVPPHFTFAVADTQYVITFVGFQIVGLVISALTARVREQAETTRHREMQTAELYEFSRDLASAVGPDEIVQAIVSHVGETFGLETAVWLHQGHDLRFAGSTRGMAVSESDTQAARQSREREVRGVDAAGSDFSARLQYIMLKTVHGVVGVLGIKAAGASLLLSSEQRLLLESFASQAALAIERAQFAEQAKQAQVMQAAERLETALLNSISHDLRTPLVSITGTLSSLQEDENDPVRQSMVETAYGEARRLNHLVGNLLDMTRIQAGAMRVQCVPCDVQDVIGSTLEQLSERLKGRKVTVELPPTLPLVPMDFVLIVQVLVNLLDNAVKYSAPDEPIVVQACIAGRQLEINVLDHGIGIPAEDLQRVFDKFYRVRRPDGVIGTGLGLAICRGIVEAHHGTVEAANREGGGTVMTVHLPLEPEVPSD